MNELIETVQSVFTVAKHVPEALRAIRLFSSKVMAGESVREALTKTAEILAAEALLG